MDERQLAQFLEGTSDAAFAADLQGEVRTWNRAAAELFGYPASLAIGRSCAEIVGGGTANGSTTCSESCDILECVRNGKGISNFDMQIKSRSGQLVWVNVSILIASNERTDRRFAIHFMRDIRARKEAERLTNRMVRIARELAAKAEDLNTLPPILPLTAQECNVLRLLAEGRTTNDVSAELKISAPTLRNHIYHANQKLHTSSRIEAVIQAIKRGLI